MDTLLVKGDHYTDARGLPVALDGESELIQRILIRLQIRKGAFVLDPELGSELYKLRHSGSEQNNRLAMGYVQEALADIPQVSVESVACTPLGDGVLQVAVGVSLSGRQAVLAVTV